MKIEDFGAKRRWSDSEKELLKKIHDEMTDKDKSSTFIDKLTESFNIESEKLKPGYIHRSSGSVGEESRRIGLKPKKPDKSPICVRSDCGILLTSKNRVGDNCRRCYNKHWYRDNVMVKVQKDIVNDNDDLPVVSGDNDDLI